MIAGRPMPALGGERLVRYLGARSHARHQAWTATECLRRAGLG